MATRNTIIAAVSNLSTAYNLTVISIVKVLIQNQYCEGKCDSEAATAATACLVGAIVGQLSFGYIGDCLGRSIALRLTMVLSILGALLSAFAVPITDDHKSIFYFLSATRFVLGVGVGGVYPLSATIASESAIRLCQVPRSPSPHPSFHSGKATTMRSWMTPPSLRIPSRRIPPGIPSTGLEG